MQDDYLKRQMFTYCVIIVKNYDNLVLNFVPIFVFTTFSIFFIAKEQCSFCLRKICIKNVSNLIGCLKFADRFRT
jgi:hypothetical protein